MKNDQLLSDIKSSLKAQALHFTLLVQYSEVVSGLMSAYRKKYGDNAKLKALNIIQDRYIKDGKKLYNKYAAAYGKEAIQSESFDEFAFSFCDIADFVMKSENDKQNRMNYINQYNPLIKYNA